MLYKVKVNDDASLKIKALIAPLCNEEGIKVDTRIDCSMCASTGVRILVSIPTLGHWWLSKVDVTTVLRHNWSREALYYG